MSKRKRDSSSPPTAPAALPAPSSSPSSPSTTGDRALDIRISRLKVRLAQGTAQLKKALNLARGFERQKLGRRQKAAEREPQVLLKLREEVIVLKQLDLGLVAERQLRRRLARVKRVVESRAYGLVWGGRDGDDGGRGEAEGNVLARLMNSNPVKGCLPGVVESVMDVLGLEKVVKAKWEESDRIQSVEEGGSKVRLAERSELTRAEDDEWSGSEAEMEDEVSLEGDAHVGKDARLQDMFETEQVGSDIDIEEPSDFSGFSSRIASSSEDSTPDTATSVSEPINSRNKAKAGPPKPEPNPSPAIRISRSVSSSPETPKQSKSKPPSSTAFLPSLMMGGYFSGSESASDIDDPRDKARKNRRGQRARQKIAEAKFGAGAKHLAKQPRDAGWDGKRGATDGNRVNAKGRMRISSSRPVNGKGPTGANGDMLGARTKEAVKEGPMHPSWEAARRRKEQGSKISIDTKGPGIGKKITFD